MPTLCFSIIFADFFLAIFIVLPTPFWCSAVRPLCNILHWFSIFSVTLCYRITCQLYLFLFFFSFYIISSCNLIFTLSLYYLCFYIQLVIRKPIGHRFANLQLLFVISLLAIFKLLIFNCRVSIVWNYTASVKL